MNYSAPFREIADKLNRDCFCMTLDQGKLVGQLEAIAPGVIDWKDLSVTHPHLFADYPAFVSRVDLDAMLGVVRAIESIARLPAYRDLALEHMPDLARRDWGPKGVFMGYDFHLTPDGPKLIEVNTNAGGAFLNALLRQAQQACCKEVSDLYGLGAAGDFTARIAEMFKTEWKLQGRATALTCIAIVDENPQGQYLYPEFVLAKTMLEQRGFQVVVCDPQDLGFHGNTLKFGSTVIDLVYNRLVDFQLEGEGHRALRDAYEAGAVVVTPGPHHHALLANKRNLVWLSDPQLLPELGTSAHDIEALRAIPKTEVVEQHNVERLWTNRKKLFFKTVAGHGGKAVYRGDKLTKSTWAEILQGEYIAQALVLPNERWVKDNEGSACKMDVRLYTYNGDIIMTAARIYQGQTTNFRTQGGGFAPVFAI